MSEANPMDDNSATAKSAERDEHSDAAAGQADEKNHVDPKKPVEAEPAAGANDQPALPAHGMFVWEHNKKGDDFNLKPADNRSVQIPDDQRKISGEVYENRNILK